MRSFICKIKSIENQSITATQSQESKMLAKENSLVAAITNKPVDKAQEVAKNQNRYSLFNDAIFHTLSFISQHELARYAGINKQWNKIVTAKTRKIEATLPALTFYPSHEIGIDWIKICNKISNGSLCSDVTQRLGIEIKYTHEALSRNIKFTDLRHGYVLEGKYGQIYFNFSNNICSYLGIEFFTKPYIAGPVSNNEKSLIAAVKNNQLNQVIKLIKFDNVNTTDEQGKPILISAVQNCHIEMVKILLENNADIEARNHHNQHTALLEAVAQLIIKQQQNNFNNEIVIIIQMLILKGANINAQDSSGKTLLHYMAETNNQFEQKNIQLANYFLEQGANLLITSYKNEAPMDGKQDCLVTKLFYRKAMHLAQSRVKDWERIDEFTYEIHFKKHLAYHDQIWTWEAIVNKLKSLAVNSMLGLANNACEASFQNHGEDRDQSADTIIPYRSEYAISKITCFNDKISISINKHLAHCLSQIHATILNALGAAHLNLKKSEKKLVKDSLPKNINQFFSPTSKSLESREQLPEGTWNYIV